MQPVKTSASSPGTATASCARLHCRLRGSAGPNDRASGGNSLSTYGADMTAEHCPAELTPLLRSKTDINHRLDPKPQCALFDNAFRLQRRLSEYTHPSSSSQVLLPGLGTVSQGLPGLWTLLVRP
jgi:hypothetical protein